MPRTLTIASQKGGVGKTTTAVNLAASLALGGRKTLLFDLDPQGNASSGVGLPKAALPRQRGSAKTLGVLGAVSEDQSLAGFIQATKIQNLSAIPASVDLSNLDLIRVVLERHLEGFRTLLEDAAQGFDYVLIDCPPSLGGLPTIALSLSHRVVIPVQCEYYAMEGLSQILPLIQKLQGGSNPELDIEGLLLTMFSNDLELSQEVVREVGDYFADKVFRTIIPRDVVLAEAASHGLPALEYAPLSRGAWSYLELAKEVLSHDWS